VPRLILSHVPWLIGLACCIGCSNSPAPLLPPSIDRGAAAAAIAMYDVNSDGGISGDELKKVPALRASLKSIDKDGDGKITANEIENRIAAWKRTGLAIMRLTAQVRRNGQPISDAEVKFVPEQFLGDALRPALGKTDSSGMTGMQISSEPDEAGVQLGFYRIQVSKKGPKGEETIPAKYNTESESGVEVYPGEGGSDGVIVDITPRT